MNQKELQALEKEITLMAARSDIESFCVGTYYSGTQCGVWYATDTISSDEEFVEKAVRYLDALGLLEHHPDNPKLVRMKKEAR